MIDEKKLQEIYSITASLGADATCVRDCPQIGPEVIDGAHAYIKRRVDEATTHLRELVGLDQPDIKEGKNPPVPRSSTDTPAPTTEIDQSTPPVVGDWVEHVDGKVKWSVGGDDLGPFKVDKVWYDRCFRLSDGNEWYYQPNFFRKVPAP